MKRLIYTFAALLLLFAAGCGGAENAAEPGGSGIIVTSFPEYDFARAVVGSGDGIKMLLKPGAESHSYEPSPSDIIDIRNADLFIYGGGESDEWLSGILEESNRRGTLSLMDIVSPIEEDDGADGGHGHHEHDGEETVYDEHVWTSPKNAALIVAAIAEELSKIYPENAKSYSENAEKYIAELNELDKELEELVSGARRKTLVFADRFPFLYLVREYGLDYIAAFAGCSSETEPGAAVVSEIIDKIKAEEIPVVFYIELSNQRLADAVAAETGAQKMLLHSCQSVTREDFEQGVTYLELMRKNYEALKAALSE